MPADSAHSNSRQTADFVFSVPLLAAVALQFLMPLYVLQGPLRLWSVAIGIVFAALGLVSISLARRTLIAAGQPVDPGKATSGLVTAGIYSISRNPLYLGASSLFLGVALIAALTWELIFIVPSMIACHYVLIKREEAYLEQKFGRDYVAYKAAVGRWLGRRNRP